MIRFADRLVSAVNAMAAAVTVTIFVVMSAQIVSRYIFNSSLFWADELAVWCLGWLVMLASVGLAWDWRHVHVPMLLLALPMRVRIPLILLSKAVSVVFLAMLVWYGTQVVAGGFHRTSPGLGLSTRWLKLAIPVSAAMMVLVVTIALVRDIGAWRRGDVKPFARYGGDEIPE